MRPLLFALVLALVPSTQTLAEPIFPPGARIGLVPAKGTLPSAGPSDFVNPAKQASVRFRELAATAYPAVERSLLNPDEAILKPVSHERTTVGGHPAVLVTATQASAKGNQLTKWLLAVREPTMTMLVVVQSVDSPDGYDDAEIRRMLDTWSRARPCLSRSK